MKITIKIIITFSIILILFISLFILPYFANIVMPWNKADAIQTTIEWGGLAPLPANARDISVETKGSKFTREFIVQFEASRSDIDEWIKKSKSLINIIPKEDENRKIIYEIYPGEDGAIGGTVVIEINKSIVIIDLSQS